MNRSAKLMHDIEQAFDSIMEEASALSALVDAINPPIWTLEGSQDGRWVDKALTDVWHADGEDGRKTTAYIGMLPADETMLARVHRLNEAKDSFRSAIDAIKALPNELTVSSVKALIGERNPAVRDHLEKRGMARVNLKQCWRHVPIAPTTLKRVHWSWYSSGRSIKRITAQDVYDKLLKLNTDAPHVKIQIEKLASLPSREVLAQVQAQAPLMRANLFFENTLMSGKDRMAMNISMPLFVPSANSVLPNCNCPSMSPPTERQRRVRRDERLEAEPFLPSLRIYRYK